MTTDRRGAPRGEVAVPVRVRRGESYFVAQLKSLSRLGALIEAGEALPVGTPLEIILELPGPGEEAHLRGQVVRVTPVEALCDLAIFFAPLPPQTLARIESFVALHLSD
jgi:PilZ domain